MQIKLYTIPVMGGEALTEEMNAFLRSKKILQTDHELVHDPHGAVWCFCIKFVEDYSPYSKGKERVDYKQVLDEVSFARFARLREIRKEIALADGVPPYAVFTDEELAELAKTETLTEAKMQEIKGIGPKKVEKFGQRILMAVVSGEMINDAEGQPPA